jgi:hypothetical protein
MLTVMLQVMTEGCADSFKAAPVANASLLVMVIR